MWRVTSGNAIIVVEDHCPILLGTWYETPNRELIDGVFDEMGAIIERTKRIAR